MKTRLGIQGKLILWLCVLLTLVITATSAVSVRRQKEALTAEIQKRGVSLAGTLARNSAEFIVTEDLDSLKHTVESLMSEDYVVYAVVLDKEGRVLMHNDLREAGKLYSDPLTLAARLSPVPRVEKYSRDSGQKLFDVAAPVKSGEERLGTVRLGYSMTAVDEADARIMEQVALLALFSGLCGLLGAILLARVIVLPVKNLTAVVKLILQEGNLNTPVDIRTGDETGELATAFNQLLSSLRVSTDRLVAAKNYAADIVDSMEDSLLILNPDASIRTMNGAAEKLLGYKKEELLAKPVRVIFAEDAPVFKGAELEKLLSTGSIKGHVSDYMTKDGKKIPVSFSASVIHGGSGAVEGIVCVGHDIRELLQLQERLSQAGKLSAVGQLAAGVAHEINNPLGIILGFAQSAAKEVKGADDPLALPLQTIEREALRCKNLVQRLLVFSRTSKSTAYTELDINSVVESALALVLTQARTNKVELVRELAPGLPRVNGDQTQLQQIVINLAGNALDAMPKGGTLTIRTALSAERPGFLELRVLDTGDGIPEELQEKIFEPFFTTKEVGKGTGIGLSLAYEAVIRHGGNMELKSEAGKGTEFTVFLPVRSGQKTEAKK